MVGALHESPKKPIAFAAGPLSLIYENGYVRSVRLGGTEIVRRIYMALRDGNWNTVPGRLDDVVIDRGDTSFFLSFNSRHRSGDIDFLWRAEVRGLYSGELSFAMHGTALSDFRRNRIGLCALHPLSACKGRPCLVTTAGGKAVHSVFPGIPAPYPVFENVRALTYRADGGIEVTVGFEGDVFETEDQRNWTDASYKTYSTPLALPAPAMVEKGATINQKIVVTLGGKLPSRTPEALRSIPSRAPELTFGTVRPYLNLPAIGVLAPRPPVGIVQESPAVSHVRVEVRFETDDVDAAVAYARRLHEEHGVPMELALHFTGNYAPEAASLARLLEMHPFGIDRFLIYKNDERSTSAPVISAVRDTLCHSAPRVPIVSGTDGYFVEINRVRPPVDLLDGVCFSATPQVHTFDDRAIMENLPGLREALFAARTISGEKETILSPLTLRPRKMPDRPLKDGGPDGRSDTLFGAAWTLGAVVYCAAGRASSLTLDEIRGATPTAMLLSWLGKKPSERIFAAPGTSSDPGRVLGIELSGNGRFSAIAANLTDENVAVSFAGLPEACGYCMLDERTFGEISLMRDRTGGLPLEKLRLKGGTFSRTLPPYALVRFAETG
jgi:D-apionolactonase